MPATHPRRWIVALVVCAWAAHAAPGLGARPPQSAPATSPPADPGTYQRLAQDGERALAAARYREAQQAYEALRRLSPGTAAVHARLGLIYFQQRKFTEAVEPLRRALALDSRLPKIDVLLAMSLSELGRFDDALAGLRRGFADASDPILQRMVGLHLQRAYTGLRRDREAVEVALELSRRHPDDPEVLYHSGRLFANFAYLQTMRLADVAPDSIWLHQAAGEADESQGLYDAAISAYRKVLALAPRRPGIHFRIGRALLASGRGGATSGDLLPEAQRAFEAELDIDPTNANAAYEIAEIHRSGADLERARTFFARALQHHPDFAQARVGLARTLIALGRFADALPHLEAVVAVQPRNKVAHYQLAQAYRALGRSADHERALATFTRLRREDERRPAVAAPKPDVTPQALDPDTPR